MKWICAKSEPPKEDGRYLVVEKCRTNYCWIGVCSLRNGKWDSEGIAYWQPLPGLPEELK